MAKNLGQIRMYQGLGIPGLWVLNEKVWELRVEGYGNLDAIRPLGTCPSCLLLGSARKHISETCVCDNVIVTVQCVFLLPLLLPWQCLVSELDMQQLLLDCNMEPLPRSLSRNGLVLLPLLVVIPHRTSASPPPPFWVDSIGERSKNLVGM
eukprot:3203696-Amphidinium_carterae.1